MFPQRDKRIITGWRYLGILGCHASPANWVRIEVLVAKVRGFRKRKQNGGQTAGCEHDHFIIRSCFCIVVCIWHINILDFDAS